MVDSKSLVLVQPIPDQIINEGAAYGPFDLKNFIQFPAGTEKIRFIAELVSRDPLPKGLICTSEGVLTDPAKDTEGTYGIVVTVEADTAAPLAVQFVFTIKPRIIIEDPYFLSKLKAQIWSALAKGIPVPDLSLSDRPITPDEIYYLLQRWATLTVWDIYNLDSRADKKLLQLEGASKHYNIYDCGSCLIAAPKDLFTYQRTLADALQTARVVAREVYKRGWAIEMEGFDKMMKAAGDELKDLGDKHGKHLEIVHYPKSGR